MNGIVRHFERGIGQQAESDRLGAKFRKIFRPGGGVVCNAVEESNKDLVVKFRPLGVVILINCRLAVEYLVCCQVLSFFTAPAIGGQF